MLKEILKQAREEKAQAAKERREHLRKVSEQFFSEQLAKSVEQAVLEDKRCVNLTMNAMEIAVAISNICDGSKEKFSIEEILQELSSMVKEESGGFSSNKIGSSTTIKIWWDRVRLS